MLSLPMANNFFNSIWLIAIVLGMHADKYGHPKAMQLAPKAMQLADICSINT